MALSRGQKVGVEKVVAGCGRRARATAVAGWKSREVGNGPCRKMVISQNVAVQRLAALAGASTSSCHPAPRSVGQPAIQGSLVPSGARADAARRAPDPPGPRRLFLDCRSTQIRSPPAGGSCVVARWWIWLECAPALLSLSPKRRRLAENAPARQLVTARPGSGDKARFVLTIETQSDSLTCIQAQEL